MPTHESWMKRRAGILLPVSSLPSKYGIGSLGKEAREWVDFLSKAKQGFWQVLPDAERKGGAVVKVSG